MTRGLSASRVHSYEDFKKWAYSWISFKNCQTSVLLPILETVRKDCMTLTLFNFTAAMCRIYWQTFSTMDVLTWNNRSDLNWEILPPKSEGITINPQYRLTMIESFSFSAAELHCSARVTVPTRWSNKCYRSNVYCTFKCFLDDLYLKMVTLIGWQVLRV